MINIKTNIRVTINKASSFKTLWDYAPPAGQHGEVVRQQGVVSAGGTRALLLQPRLYTLRTNTAGAAHQNQSGLNLTKSNT